jgi:protein tyrosine phosphatase (PTP) superfamily phosphohydrolase (DUF442 family)
MKPLFIAFVLSLSITPILAQSQQNKMDTIAEYKNLYQFQNFYLSGQPTLEALYWLKEQGVTKVINLRSESEMDDYTSYAYNEEEKAIEFGLEYFHLPVGGKSGYTPENLAKLDSIVTPSDKVLLHCAGAGRIRYFFIAYLVKSKGYSLEQAIEIGEQMGYYNPLDLLLKTEPPKE